jgi:hypothetical protein
LWAVQTVTLASRIEVDVGSLERGVRVRGAVGVAVKRYQVAMVTNHAARNTADPVSIHTDNT